MTGPTPIAGRNPYTLAYQNSQFGVDASPGSVTGDFTVLDHLSNPPASGIAAEASPSFVEAEDTTPPVGAGDNEPGSTLETQTDPLYPETEGGASPGGGTPS